MDIAYVINLDSRKDRWETIQKEFKNLPFRLERISAVTSNPPAHGTFLSSIKAIKKAKQKGLNSITILEDDCLPLTNFTSKWQKIKTWLDNHPTEWDIYSGAATHIFMPDLIGEYKGIKFFNPLYSLSAHFIHIPKRSYEKVLNHYNNFIFTSKLSNMLASDVFNNMLKTIISYPFIAIQDDGYSNVTKHHRSRRKTFKNSEKVLKDL